jgi:hypothetical protein
MNTNAYPIPASMNQYVRTTDSPTFSSVYTNDWIRMNTVLGLICPGTNNAQLYANNGSYGAWKIEGSRNSYGGIEVGGLSNGNISWMVNLSSNTTGFHNHSYGWQFYWESGNLYVGKATYGGGTTATVLDSSNYSSYALPYSGGNISGYLNLGVNNGTPYANATGVGNGIAFGGIEGNLRMYGIFTELENIGGNYSKLTINYHTGIRLGAYYGYGGTRFYNNSVGGGGTVIFSVGNGDDNVRATNDIIAYASDKRLKHNIQPIENALSKVISLKGMTYQWNEVGSQHGWTPDTKIREAGVFAQDIQAVLPEAVRLAPFDDNMGVSKSGENFLTVKYEKIVPLLIEAIKEQQLQIEELKAKLK